MSDADTLPETTPSVEEWEPDGEAQILRRERDELLRRNSAPLWCTRFWSGNCDGRCGIPHIQYEVAQAMQQRRREVREQSDQRVRPPSSTTSQESSWENPY